mmetsp:Transcript_11151/g.33405  ORF Transcript_11151/g.33405 Transcript_11151/m.33405 type:complete len:244 (+) Transcript_11151:4168-4899(+)
MHKCAARDHSTTPANVIGGCPNDGTEHCTIHAQRLQAAQVEGLGNVRRIQIHSPRARGRLARDSKASARRRRPHNRAPDTTPSLGGIACLGLSLNLGTIRAIRRCRGGCRYITALIGQKHRTTQALGQGLGSARHRRPVPVLLGIKAKFCRPAQGAPTDAIHRPCFGSCQSLIDRFGHHVDGGAIHTEQYWWNAHFVHRWLTRTCQPRHKPVVLGGHVFDTLRNILKVQVAKNLGLSAQILAQ